MLATVWQILNIMPNDRKRKFSDLAETCLANSVKPQQVNIFLADFSYLKPLWGGSGARGGAEAERTKAFLYYFEGLIARYYTGA